MVKPGHRSLVPSTTASAGPGAGAGPPGGRPHGTPRPSSAAAPPFAPAQQPGPPIQPPPPPGQAIQGHHPQPAMGPAGPIGNGPAPGLGPVPGPPPGPNSGGGPPTGPLNAPLGPPGAGGPPPPPAGPGPGPGGAPVLVAGPSAALVPVPTGAPPPGSLAFSETASRLNSLLDYIKHEFDLVTSDYINVKVHKDETEQRMNAQIAELQMMQHSFLELEQRHLATVQRYEDEIARLKQALDSRTPLNESQIQLQQAQQQQQQASAAGPHPHQIGGSRPPHGGPHHGGAKGPQPHLPAANEPGNALHHPGPGGPPGAPQYRNGGGSGRETPTSRPGAPGGPSAHDGPSAKRSGGARTNDRDSRGPSLPAMQQSLSSSQQPPQHGPGSEHLPPPPLSTSRASDRDRDRERDRQREQRERDREQRERERERERDRARERDRDHQWEREQRDATAAAAMAAGRPMDAAEQAQQGGVGYEHSLGPKREEDGPRGGPGGYHHRGSISTPSELPQGGGGNAPPGGPPRGGLAPMDTSSPPPAGAGAAGGDTSTLINEGPGAPGNQWLARLGEEEPDDVASHLKIEGSDWLAIFNPALKKRSLTVGLMHTFTHESVVCCVRFSPDGKYLATGCNRSAQIYDTKTGAKVCVLNDQPWNSKGDLYIRSVCFSPDGKYLATGAEDRQIRIWDIASETVHQVFKDHKQEIYSLDYSADGRIIASGSGDKTVRLWDVETGRQLHVLYTVPGPELPSSEAGVTSVSISRDSRLVAAGALDTYVRIWDTRTGDQLEMLKGHKDSIYSVAFAPDGKSLVSGSLDRTLKCWELDETLRRLDEEDKRVGRGPPGSGGRGGGSNAEVKNGAAGGGSNGSNQDGGDGEGGKRAGPSVDSNGEDVKNLATCGTTFYGHKDYVLSVSCSPDGQWIASGSKDRGVQFWDPKTGQVQCVLQGHKNSVIAINLSPAGRMLATGSGDFTARIWSFDRI